MSIKKDFIVYTLCLCSFFASGQSLPKESHEAIIWRGFHHQWDYNHRINCMGDYVKRFDFDFGKNPTSTHISATGTGPDKTYYDSYYTLLQTRSAVFLEMHEPIHLRGSYDRMEQDTSLFPLSFDDPQIKMAWLCGKSNFVTVLNGFEMHADSFEADKLKQFKIELVDTGYDRNSCTFYVKINIKTILNCQTLECNKRNKYYDYAFDIYFLIIAYDSNEASASIDSFTNVYQWNKCKPLKEKITSRIVKGDSPSEFPYATVGLKSFSISLDRALHLLQWDNYLLEPQIKSFGPKSNVIEVPTSFQFKQWQKGMKGSHPWQSIFSMRESGKDTVGFEFVTLQFKTMDSLSYLQNHQDPVMYWRGGNCPSFKRDLKKCVIYDSTAIQIYNIGTNAMDDPQKRTPCNH